MSRKTEDASNKGKEYTEEECNFIAFCLIWGICLPERLATKLKRGDSGAIEALFKRICQDGSDYPDMRGEYKLWPIITSVKLEYVNHFAWQFICEQHLNRDKSLKSISERVGLDIQTMKDKIEAMTGKKLKDGLL